jgi:RNA polymerase sigma factor (sigma-70 family)
VTTVQAAFGRPGAAVPEPDPPGSSSHRTDDHWEGSDLTDGELLDLCRAGDAESWDVLVRRYSQLVATVAVRAGLPPEDAKDVTQATFIALLESGTRIRQGERISSWLVTVAQRKSWRARRTLEHELLIDELPERFEDPAETWDRVAVLHAGLIRLGGPCRELLETLYLDPSCPSYAEVAARLGRAVGTIGPTRGRCLEKLRAMIGEDVW